jgi:hypothetical protein
VVDLVTKSITYATNSITRMLFRVEHGRIVGGHFMVDNEEKIEKGLRVWLREQTLLAVHCELYSPDADEAYERCTIEVAYREEATEEVSRPPIEQLEELMRTLEKLPDDAQFRLLMALAPGYTEVPGWGDPGGLKDLKGGLKKEHQIGGEHGFGHIHGSTRYFESNWNSQGH